MTDNEIITDYREEIEKPRYLTVGIFWNVLDLINRQKSQIESLQEVIIKKEDLMQMLCSQKQGYYDELVSAKAEIERLRKESDEGFNKWIILDERTKERYAELYEEAKEVLKSEARKDFVERLKEMDGNEFLETGRDGADVFDYFNQEKYEAYLDNLLEEMESESE